MRVTVPSPLFATQTAPRRPRSRSEPSPTGIVVVTALVLGSIRTTASSLRVGDPDGARADARSPPGRPPTVIGVSKSCRVDPGDVVRRRRRRPKRRRRPTATAVGPCLRIDLARDAAAARVHRVNSPRPVRPRPSCRRPPATGPPGLDDRSRAIVRDDPVELRVDPPRRSPKGRRRSALDDPDGAVHRRRGRSACPRPGSSRDAARAGIDSRDVLVVAGWPPRASRSRERLRRARPDGFAPCRPVFESGSITATAFPCTVTPPEPPWPNAKTGIAIAAASTPIRAEPAYMRRLLRRSSTSSVLQLRELVLQPVDLELVEALRLVDVLQAPFAHVSNRDPGGGPPRPAPSSSRRAAPGRRGRPRRSARRDGRRSRRSVPRRPSARRCAGPCAL